MIIGGIAGILTAYFLHQSGIKYMLVERDRICGENTQNTTARITVQHGIIYNMLLRNGGEFAAKQYFKVNTAAFDRYAELCRIISCDYEIKDIIRLQDIIIIAKIAYKLLEHIRCCCMF